MDMMNQKESRTEVDADMDCLGNVADSDIESKADRFKRLSVKRVNATMKQIELISNLSGGSYEYTEEQVNKIFDTLQESLDSAKAKFSKVKQKKESFSFD